MISYGKQYIMYTYGALNTIDYAYTSFKFDPKPVGAVHLF